MLNQAHLLVVTRALLGTGPTTGGPLICRFLHEKKLHVKFERSFKWVYIHKFSKETYISEVEICGCTKSRQLKSFTKQYTQISFLK